MTQQKGFAHAFLIIGLVIALLGALGFVYWQNFIYKEPVTTKTDIIKQDSKDTKDSAPDTKDETGYLVIKEWDVKAKIPTTLANTEIVYSLKLENTSMDIITSRSKKILDACEYEKTAGSGTKASVSIYRSKDKAKFDNTEVYKLLKDETVGGYYYAHSAWVPLTYCQTEYQTQKDDAGAFVEMFKELEAI